MITASHGLAGLLLAPITPHRQRNLPPRMRAFATAIFYALGSLIGGGEAAGKSLASISKPLQNSS